MRAAVSACAQAFICAVVVALGAVGCGRASSREAQISDTFTRGTPKGGSAVGDDLRLALCGWRPLRFATFDLRDLSITLQGDEKAGTGEARAKLVASSNGYACSGVAAFTYELHKDRNNPDSTLIRALRGAGPAAIFAEVERRATPLAFGTPVQVSPTTWALPDGTGAAAFRFDVQTAGLTCWSTPPIP